MIKQLILGKIKEYLLTVGIKTKKVGKMLLFPCPYCNNPNANTIPNSSNLNCLSCKKRFTLLDVIRKLENKEGSDDEIIEYLKSILKIDGVITKKEENKTKELLDFYEKMGFDLVPVAVKCHFCDGKGCGKCNNTGNYGKKPIEKEWQHKNHKNKEEWEQWLSNSLNIGVKCGVISNITVIDIDTKEIPKELEELLGDTLIQQTPHGQQYYYQFEEDLPKTHIEEYKIDLETTGGQCVIEPSITIKQTRHFLELKVPIKMPEGLKKFLKDKITVPRKTNSEKIREDIQTEDFKIDPKDFLLKNNNLEGCCNSSFVKLGGILRKNLNIKQTNFVLQLLNRHLLENPMDDRTVYAMVQELDRYIVFDEQELAHEILEHIKEVKEITKSDLELSIAGEWTKGEAKKRFNKTMQYLIKEEKITQRGKKIKVVEDLNWVDTLIDIGSPLDYKIPYLNDYAYFCKGDIVILGSKFGYGKSTLAINIIKRIVDQKIKPYYIYSEKQGGRFARTATHLGLREGDFYSARCSNPDNIILRPNSFIIYDWVRPTKDEGFARTDLLFDKLVEKSEKTNSFLICFVQLKVDDTFFAPNMIGQYPAVLAKYVHESNDGIYTKFVFEKIREPKIQGGKIEVPCIYNWKEKSVKLVEELSEEEQKNIIKKKEKFKK